MNSVLCLTKRTSFPFLLRKGSAIPNLWISRRMAPTVAIHHAENERPVANSHGISVFHEEVQEIRKACLLLVLRAVFQV